MRILVIGAGFAGSVVARELAEGAGHKVTLIDRRDHLAGNAYDPVHPISGTRYHRYGPHIFHSRSDSVVEYLSRFTSWLPYKHRVEALLESGDCVPMPINIDTINIQQGIHLSGPADLDAYLEQVRIPAEGVHNAEDHLRSLYGQELTELFFARYTRKMWGLPLAELPVSLVKRLPIRRDRNPYYFNDKYQMMPADGYHALIRRILDHPKIEVRLSQPFEKAMEVDYEHVFNSMAIDEYFDFQLGPLPYRSIKFEHRFGESFCYPVPTVNFTDLSPYTRKTAWALYPGGSGKAEDHVTYEIPCRDEENNMERYYPIKTADGWPQQRYQAYKQLAEGHSRMTFIGRCGQYQYYDMDQVVANSLMICRRFLARTEEKG